MRNRTASLAGLLVLASLVATPAATQAIFKWTDVDGKVQYSDKPPKGFAGEVTRIDVEYDKMPPPVAVPAPAPDKAGAPPAAADDILSKRRATRAHLTARLLKARDGVEAAKKALTDADSPEADERQVVQQRGAAGGMHGMAPRSNCRTEKDKNGRSIVMCPTAIPTPEYHERVAGLEENVRKAEEELAAAEQAFRRGVD